MHPIFSHARSTRSVSHMPRQNPTRPCAVRTRTSSHQTLPTLLLRSVCMTLRNLKFVPSVRRSQMQTTKRWILKMTTRLVPPLRLPRIVRLVFFYYLPNHETVFAPSCSTVRLAQVQPSNKLHCSNLPQEVTNGVLAVLFQQYVSTSHRLTAPLSQNFQISGFSDGASQTVDKTQRSGRKGQNSRSCL
jgi:hypothetical protein